jgi:hypothetical protein
MRPPQAEIVNTDIHRLHSSQHSTFFIYMEHSGEQGQTQGDFFRFLLVGHLSAMLRRELSCRLRGADASEQTMIRRDFE